ncbi:MAG: GntR family transcriptional regulator [Treponema sp.]|nr:MAG: GntR family transcriptional regulator [Treponema sp.]
MEYESTRPIYLQIIEKVKRKIIVGEIRPDDKLLSLKDMALEMGVNPNTVYRVYRELEAEGIVETRRGFGTFVVADDGLIEKLQDEIIDETIFQPIKTLVDLGFSGKKISQYVDIALNKLRSKE